jgi:hypothetical protein
VHRCIAFLILAASYSGTLGVPQIVKGLHPASAPGLIAARISLAGMLLAMKHLLHLTQQIIAGLPALDRRYCRWGEASWERGHYR